MSKSSFSDLLERVCREPSWSSISKRKAPSISEAELLAGVLYPLFHGGTFRNGRDVFGISRSYLHELEPIVLDAVMSAIQMDPSSQARMPQTAAEIQQEALKWTTGRTADDDRFTFLGSAGRSCIGAGDGTLVPVRLRQAGQRWDVTPWFCRKGLFVHVGLSCSRFAVPHRL